MRLVWVGGPTARIEIGSFRILTDPMLGEGPEAFIMRRHPSTGELNVPIARLTPLPPVDLDDLDMVIASHLHSDHFDDQAIAQLDKELELVAPTAHLPQLQEWGFERLTGWSGIRSEPGARMMSGCGCWRYLRITPTTSRLIMSSGL